MAQLDATAKFSIATKFLAPDRPEKTWHDTMWKKIQKLLIRHTTHISANITCDTRLRYDIKH